MCEERNVNKEDVIIALPNSTFDIKLADKFEYLVNNAIEAGKKKIVVDFQVKDISFQASGLLMGCHKKCEQKGIQFYLVCNNRKIIEFFEKKGMASTLDIFPTLSEAMKKEVQVDGEKVQECPGIKWDAGTQNGSKR